MRYVPFLYAYHISAVILTCETVFDQQLTLIDRIVRPGGSSHREVIYLPLTGNIEIGKKEPMVLQVTPASARLPTNILHIPVVVIKIIIMFN